MSNLNKPPQTIYCRNRSGLKLQCEILDKKVTANSVIMYYVHYKNTDKRMDEWVSSNRLESVTEIAFTLKKPRKCPNTPRNTAISNSHGPPCVQIKNVDKIIFGEDTMEAWYFSPIPKEFIGKQGEESIVFFCDFCLRYFPCSEELSEHYKNCKIYHPPGNEIYRSKESNITINVFEIDGEVEIEYCQNICYLSKLFLDHKTLQYDTVPFLFYVLCEISSAGCRFIGYFSKEKFSELDYNLACIMTLPCYQKRGFGNFLISLSYELSKIENKIGTPERPLSDLGQATYNKYWYKRAMEVFEELGEPGILSLGQMSELSFITVQDIHDTLTKYNCIVQNPDNTFSIKIPTKDKLQQLFALRNNSIRLCDPEKIHWVPYNNIKNKQFY